MIDTGLWFMFPVAVGIATIAMLAGIGGAVMFAPFFMLVLRLDPLIALGAGLAIEVFGVSSGAALATVVGVLIEVPVMLMLVAICKKTCGLFRECHLDLPQCAPTAAGAERAP